jgi:hypothetical protein
MAAHRLQELLGLAVWRTGVAARHDRAKPIAAVPVRLDPATEVIGRLRGIENDGARGAASEPGAPLGLVEAQIEKMLEHDAWYDQSELVLLARLSEIGDASPELVHRDVELVNGNHQVDEEAVDHLLQAWVALAIVEAGSTSGQSDDHVLFDQIGWHVSTLLLLLFPDVVSGRLSASFDGAAAPKLRDISQAAPPLPSTIIEAKPLC